MKLYTHFLVLLIGLLFSQCTPSKKKETETTKKPTHVQQIGKREVKFEAEMRAIEEVQDFTTMNSLAYNTNSSSRIEVIAYLDKKSHPKKIEEKFYDASTGNYGTNTFYTENDIVFATKEVYYDNTLTTPSFIERISFYNKKNKAIFSKQRVAPFEEDLAKHGFQIVSPKGCSSDRATRALNKTGEFTTTFQGFVHENGLNYLIVGENTPDGYASSLAIQYEDAVIKKLKQEDKKYFGRVLEVTHGTVTDERGMKFQVLLSVKIV